MICQSESIGHMLYVIFLTGNAVWIVSDRGSSAGGCSDLSMTLAGNQRGGQSTHRGWVPSWTSRATPTCMSRHKTN